MLYWIKPELLQDIKGKPEDFIANFQSCNSADRVFALAVAHDQLGHGHDSEKLYRKALQKDIRHYPSLYALSFKCFQNGKELQGKNNFKRALRFDPDGEASTLFFQKELKYSVASYNDACRLGVWCLQELLNLKKATARSKFQLGKVLFEQSNFEEAIGYLKEALKVREFSQESTEYLSYIYEHLYQGNELIDQTLELAKDVPDRSDLFFNLAMVCQHDQKRLDLAMHFFYLAAREDPNDPGLKFSLEQAALEMITQLNRSGRESDPFFLMIAHYYQGSSAAAQKYANELKDFHYPESFQALEPTRLWNDWLINDKAPLGRTLKSWFGPDKNVVKISSKKS
jgi:tetratricopeptide (TPR) repeat protein